MSQKEEDPSHYTHTLVVKPALSQKYDQLLPTSKSLETACKNHCTRYVGAHHVNVPWSRNFSDCWGATIEPAIKRCCLEAAQVEPVTCVGTAVVVCVILERGKYIWKQNQKKDLKRYQNEVLKTLGQDSAGVGPSHRQWCLCHENWAELKISKND